ncbi:spore coat U domain-containing protein [soil metagenome]
MAGWLNSLRHVSVLVVAIAVPASAETSRTFQVAATVAQGCLVATNSGGGTWGNIDLGTVSGIGAQSASGNLLSSGITGIQMDCTPGSTVSVTANQGNNGSPGGRQLVHAGNATSLIPYLLYANGSATPWTTQAVSLSFSAGTSHFSLPVRAVANLLGPTRGGAYSDTVQITVSW